MNWLTPGSSLEELDHVRREVIDKLNMWVTIGQNHLSTGNQNHEGIVMVWDSCALIVKVHVARESLGHFLYKNLLSKNPRSLQMMTQFLTLWKL